MGVRVFHQSFKGAFSFNTDPVGGLERLRLALCARSRDVCHDITIRCAQEVTIHSVSKGHEELEMTCEVHWSGDSYPYTSTAIRAVLNWYCGDILRCLNRGGAGGGGFKLSWPPLIKKRRWGKSHTTPSPPLPPPPPPPPHARYLTKVEAEAVIADTVSVSRLPNPSANNRTVISRYDFGRDCA